MMLAQGRMAVNAAESLQRNLVVQDGRIHRLRCSNGTGPAVDLSGFLILPGLINAHDHLEFNLFPRLGHGPYANATDWANEIHRPREAPLLQHLRVPKAVRLFWGGIKNLLSGVTSVSHHNEYQAGVFECKFPIRVVKRFGWAHSLTFCSDVEKRFRETPPNAPFIIHAGEGRDVQARHEIHQLERSGLLTPSTVIVHGVALQSEDLGLIARSGASVIWCPTSNYFTLGRTLSLEVLESGIPVTVGTDSALTAQGDFVDELRAASSHVHLARLYQMVTQEAARILRLNSGEGCIREGGIADLVIVADRNQKPAEALLDLHPELVIVNGRIKLFSARMADRLRLLNLPDFEPIEVEGRGRWFIDCPVSALVEQARRELKDDFRLAGKRVIV